MISDSLRREMDDLTRVGKPAEDIAEIRKLWLDEPLREIKTRKDAYNVLLWYYGMDGFSDADVDTMCRLSKIKRELMAAGKGEPIEGGIDTIHASFAEWLLLRPENGDHDVIDTILACACDRDIAGDPVWMFVIAPSGGAKTEFLRTLNKHDRTYTLDSLTSKALISGKQIGLHEDGSRKFGGILHALDGKVAVIKDFTTIISAREEERNEVFSTLRNTYDGKFEKAFGTSDEKISVRASFGVIAAVTPVLDIYQKLHTSLGERWLKIRSHVKEDNTDILERAFDNLDIDAKREETTTLVAQFLSSLDYANVPTVPKDMKARFVRLARYLELMRCWVHLKVDKDGQIYDGSIPVHEIGSRAIKQLKKLSIMLALVREHEEVTEEDIATIRRVVRDSSLHNRQLVLNAYNNIDQEEVQANEVSTESGLLYRTARKELERLELLQVMKSREVREDYLDKEGIERWRSKKWWRMSEDFKPLNEEVNR